MPAQYPSSGYGPIDQGRRYESPFDAADNSINYQNMMSRQMVTQYHQPVIEPATMTHQQARMVAGGDRFTYGVPEGQLQTARRSSRQASLNRMAYSSALAKSASSIGGWELASVAGTAAGLGGLSALALPAMVASPFISQMNKGIERELEMRKYQHGIATDVEQYRGQ